MKYLLLIALLIPLYSHAQIKSSGKAAKTPWGGTWWSMRKGELALGWYNNVDGRVQNDKSFALEFDKCISDTAKKCTNLFNELNKEKGKTLSPTMKFDLWVKNQVDAAYGVGNYPNMYSRATKNELEIHYIDNNPSHRHYEASGFAGKCTGWSLSAMEYAEPTKTKTINGVTFTPTDIKGILAAIHYAGQFFVPDQMYLGNAYRAEGPDHNQKFYDDPDPHLLINALEKHIKKDKKMIVADMDPSPGVWNHPVYAYELVLKEAKGTKVEGTLTLRYANDEVGIDDVFSTQTKRTDLLERALTLELTVPADWDKKIEKVKSSKWTGASKDKHPDSIILGLESGWRSKVYEYKNTEMKLEVNFQIIKKVNLGSGYKVIVDELLKKYYQ